jgi:hypothetical protein
MRTHSPDADSDRMAANDSATAGHELPRYEIRVRRRSARQ